jgi:Domain of unknown function (DUF1772)
MLKSSLMEMLLKFLALFSAGMFAGASLYVTTVEHRARTSLGPAAAIAEFRPSYQRAAPQQATLASVCFLCGVAVAVLSGDWIWAVGGVTVGAVVPFTLVFMMPTNRRLSTLKVFHRSQAKRC